MRRNWRKGDDDGEEEINLTPMLDMVFIMLIFFIVTASFVKEAGIEVNRPGAVTAAEKENASIMVAISPDGEVWIDKRPVDIRAVRANIERMRAENPQAGVVIIADQESKNRVLVQVMDAARLAGVRDVSIAAEITD